MENEVKNDCHIPTNQMAIPNPSSNSNLNVNGNITKDDVLNNMEIMKEIHDCVILNFNQKINKMSSQLCDKVRNDNSLIKIDNKQWATLINRHKIIENDFQIYLNNYSDSLSKLFFDISQSFIDPQTLANCVQFQSKDDLIKKNEEIIIEKDPIYKYSITSDDSVDNDISVLTKHRATLTEIEFNNITQYTVYISSLSIEFPNLERIVISNGKWDPMLNTNNKSIQSSNTYPKLREIVINEMKITQSKSLLLFPLFASLQRSIFYCIQILKLDKMELVNCEFDIILDSIVINESIRKTICLLSFEDNSITVMNLKKKVNKNDEECNDMNVFTFDNLKEINMKKNKLFSFRIDYDLFPNLRLINLINNSIAIDIDIDLPNKKKNKSILVLCNNNTVITLQHFINTYIQRLNQVLPCFDYPIPCMTFEGLFNRSNQMMLQGFKLSEVAFASLKELNMSNCGLVSDSIIQLIKNNKHISNLEYLLLNSNMITMSFFNQYWNDLNERENDKDKNRDIFLKELKHLDLSCNLIEDSNFNDMNEFIILHLKLTKLKLELNPFGVHYGVEMKDKKQSNQINSTMNTNTNSDTNINTNTKTQSIIDFAMLFNQISSNNRDIEIDFSTESRIIKMKKVKKKGYHVKVKKKH